MGLRTVRAKLLLDVGQIGIKLSAGWACWPAIVGEGPLRCKGLSCEVPHWSAVNEGPRPEAIRREKWPLHQWVQICSNVFRLRAAALLSTRPFQHHNGVSSSLAHTPLWAEFNTFRPLSSTTFLKQRVDLALVKLSQHKTISYHTLSIFVEEGHHRCVKHLSGTLCLEHYRGTNALKFGQGPKNESCLWIHSMRDENDQKNPSTVKYQLKRDAGMAKETEMLFARVDHSCSWPLAWGPASANHASYIAGFWYFRNSISICSNVSEIEKNGTTNVQQI